MSRLVVTLLLGILWASMAGSLSAQSLDELPLDRWKKLRETERYQLQIAEKYYRDKDWKVAAAEYEKYLSLYEKSEASAYAQLKWSLAQVQLKKHNTAIKEGFQSILDYWPESPEARAAGYYLGQTYKAMGQVAKAKTAYKAVVASHAGSSAAVYSLADLAEIAGTEKDQTTRLQLLRKLAFEVTRTPPTQGPCIQAARRGRRSRSPARLPRRDPASRRPGSWPCSTLKPGRSTKRSKRWPPPASRRNCRTRCMPTAGT